MKHAPKLSPAMQTTIRNLYAHPDRKHSYRTLALKYYTTAREVRNVVLYKARYKLGIEDIGLDMDRLPWYKRPKNCHPPEEDV